MTLHPWLALTTLCLGAFGPFCATTATAQSDPRLGLPELPPLRADSPLDSLLFADRIPVGQDTSGYESYNASLSDGFISDTDTGTGFPEIFKYQIPDGYDPNGPPHPMVVAYHGFGASASTPASQSTIDEECNARNWFFMSPTGIDDKLFGSPVSQQNSEAAIQWMLDHFNIDNDRLYIVGFSMGGGIAANFAARRRDPDGIMFAGLGMVSATIDWAMEYNVGFPDLNAWMINPFNFGGTPSDDVFPYQQASAIYTDEATYPPYPGTIIDGVSMITNLVDIPTYITFDVGDVLPRVPVINSNLEQELVALGHTTAIKVQSGTVNPSDGSPAPHSWAVLDELELFDFFDGLSVDRHPQAFAAQLDLGGAVSWVGSSQAVTDSFTYIAGSADGAVNTLAVEAVVNATDVAADVLLAGVPNLPRVSATSADGLGFRLTLSGFNSSPSYLTDANTGLLVPGVDSDPFSAALTVTVPAQSSLEFDVMHDPDWTAVITSTPNPVSVGGSTQVDLIAAPGSVTAWIILAVDEQLLSVKGVTIAVAPVLPAVLLPVALDALGTASFPASIPNDPGLVGLRLPTQAVIVDGANTPTEVTNLWGFTID